MTPKITLVFAGLAVLGCAVVAQTSLGPGPFPVYNQAYQENYAADALPDILERAKGAYVLLDPFGEEPQDWGQVVAQLKANANAVGAYISIGTGEDWRADFAALQPALVTTPWDQWAGEYFVTATDIALPVMLARIDKIAALGFDWVEFDNMDWAMDDDYRQTYGFATTARQAAAYFQALCDRVHAAGLRCMAKNLTEGAETFDGVLYESYADDQNWWDQAGAQSFVAAGKPVIIVHYDAGNCAADYDEYQAVYGPSVSFICEDSGTQRYVHFNQ